MVIERLQGREPLREAWKFFSGDCLGLIQNEASVRIGTSASFRMQDNFDDGRADPREMRTGWDPGATRVTSAHPFFASLLGAGRRAVAPEIPIEIEEGARFTLDYNAYILCLSDAPDDALYDGMLRKFGYDWFYHISDLERFIAMLIDADPRLQHGGQCQHVVYDAPEEFEREFRPCIFRKRPLFSWQREIRIIWQGVEPLEPFNVRAPDLSRFVSIERNPAAVGSS